MVEPPIWDDNPELRAQAEQLRATAEEERNKAEAGEGARHKGNGHDASQPLRPWPVMAAEAFDGPAGDIVRVIGPHTESDPVGLLLTLHTYFGNAVGRGPYYWIEATRHYAQFYVLTIGRTAKSRKGTGDARARQVFWDADPDWCCNRVKSGLSSGEGVIWEVRNRIIKTNKKGEEEVVDDGVADKRLLVVQSEFVGALHAMKRDGSLLSTVLRDAWDTGNLATLVKHSPARATGALVSIIGHITEHELKQHLDQTSMANGFANRYLFACVKRSKLLPFGGNLPERDVLAMAAVTRTAIARAKEIGEVRMSPEAAEGWAAIYPVLSAERPGLLGAITARAEAQTIRLAMSHALWEGKDRIGLKHLMSALAVWNYCDASAKYVFGDSLGDPIADTILTALRGAGAAGLTRTEISNLFARNTSSGQISRALGELLQCGLAAPTRATDDGAGRPTEIWVAAMETGPNKGGSHH